MPTNNDDEPVKPQRILLAEDSITYQHLALGLLEKLGHSVVVVGNGAQVLGFLEKDPILDLVLMDVLMPVMDGLEATREIRRREQTTGDHIPIIAVTGNTADDDRNECFAAGMDDFVLKPIRPPELQQAIMRVTQLQNARTGAPAISNKFTADEAVANILDQHYSVAIKAVAGDKVLLRQVVLASLDEFPELLAKMASALATGNIADLRRASHTMKGSLRLFAARQASSLAMFLSTSIDESNIDELRETLDKLKSEFAILRSQLRLLASRTTDEIEKENHPHDTDFQMIPNDPHQSYLD